MTPRFASSTPTFFRHPCWDGWRYPPVAIILLILLVMIDNHSFLSISSRVMGRNCSSSGSAPLGMRLIISTLQYDGMISDSHRINNKLKTSICSSRGHSFLMLYVMPVHPPAEFAGFFFRVTSTSSIVGFLLSSAVRACFFSSEGCC